MVVGTKALAASLGEATTGTDLEGSSKYSNLGLGEAATGAYLGKYSNCSNIYM